jgi:hypothetical protein
MLSASLRPPNDASYLSEGQTDRLAEAPVLPDRGFSASAAGLSPSALAPGDRRPLEWRADPIPGQIAGRSRERTPLFNPAARKEPAMALDEIAAAPQAAFAEV